MRYLPPEVSFARGDVASSVCGLCAAGAIDDNFVSSITDVRDRTIHTRNCGLCFCSSFRLLLRLFRLWILILLHFRFLANYRRSETNPRSSETRHACRDRRPSPSLLLFSIGLLRLVRSLLSSGGRLIFIIALSFILFLCLTRRDWMLFDGRSSCLMLAILLRGRTHAMLCAGSRNRRLPPWLLSRWSWRR